MINRQTYYGFNTTYGRSYANLRGNSVEHNRFENNGYHTRISFNLTHKKKDINNHSQKKSATNKNSPNNKFIHLLIYGIP